jgi:hypothetical protein
MDSSTIGVRQFRVRRITAMSFPGRDLDLLKLITTVSAPNVRPLRSRR